MIHTSTLLQAAGFVHGFTTRAAGDFARGRQLPGLAFPSPLFLLEQVHGVAVREVGPTDELRVLANERGDALVARRASAVGVRTADCVPLLYVDPEQDAVAAVHAGWRGLAAGIAREALTVLGPGAAARVLVALGPSIGPCCFEVDQPVARTLAASSSAACVQPAANPAKRATHAQVDLRTALETQLAALGVDAARVQRVGGCSRCDAEGFHSHRRDGAASGRMLSFVAPRAVASV